MDAILSRAIPSRAAATTAAPIVVAPILALALTGSPLGAQEPLPECVWCGTAEAPAGVDWRTTIAGPDEPGERLLVRGTVCRADGRTPAAGVILYLYHTNAEGIYETLGDETGNGRRHGHLRGWVRTDGRGRYQVRTVRPGPYPGRETPAHVHVTVKEPDDTPEYALPSFNFAGDPLLDDPADAPHVVRLRRGGDGVWRGRRDLVLPVEVERRRGRDGVWYAPVWPADRPSRCSVREEGP